MTRDTLPIVLLFFLASVGSAQESPQAQFREELQVVEVLLDVLVTDHDGRVILGLERDDFVVEEEGTPVAIQGFSFYSNRSPLGDSEMPERSGDQPPPQDRFFVLFFYRPPVASYNDFTRASRMPGAGRESFQWLVEDLLPNDYVAVVAFDGALNLVHDFSQDRHRLGAAIALASAGKAPKKRWPSRTEEPLPGRTLRLLAAHDELRRDTDDLFAALETLATALGEIRGRKVLVLFGPDFPDAGSDAARRGYEPMVRRLNTHNVAVYGIDVARRGRLPTPVRLAEETGGEYLHASGGVRQSLRAIERQNNGYYLLSYRSSHTASESGYRRVEVRSRNPELRVRSRSGYLFGHHSPDLD